MRRPTALTAVSIWLGLAGVAHAQSRPPARLDDAAFWSLFVELSEPDGFYADNNFVSNELGLQRVLPKLEQTFEPGGVYLGVGPEQNFSYVAALRPRIAFIVDIRRQNAMEHLLYKALFELTENRADFVSRLFSRPRPPGLDSESTVDELFTGYRATPADRALFETTLAAVFRVLVERHGFALDDADRAAVAKVFAAFYEEGPEIHYVFRERDHDHPSYFEVMQMTDDSGTNWSYLGSEERFQRVKRMQLANLIVPVVGDFAGPRTMRAIADYVRGLGDTIDVFYVSNVEQYLFPDGPWRSFYDNVSTFPLSADAIFIRSFFRAARRCDNPSLPNRTPVTASIANHLEDYRSGEIETECALAERSL
jgi:hypothetical protein